MFHIVKRTAVVARALFILLYRLVMILWNAGRAGRLAVVIGGFVALFLLLSLIDPVPAATQTAAMPAPITETTPTPVIVAPTATVEPTPVVTEPAATELPEAIQEMAAPEVVTPTEAPAEGSAPPAEVSAPPESAPPVVEVDQPAASNESAPCAPGQYKGNRNSHIFHAPGQLAYARTHANVTCFDTAAQATAAGYRAAKR